LTAGQKLGAIKRVLRRDKGRPVSMLHLELYRACTPEQHWSPVWNLNDPIPTGLIDPEPFLSVVSDDIPVYCNILDNAL
jgi:hypothetical protein